ncbi:MAG: hypothetical protein EOP87_03085 [Verrucomicrobiaceae bacterium]|nr:MAG: hypothetical protein EOP87_03085 [Verrucomicrobiaceae bacterium]
MSTASSSSTDADWFRASEATGDFMGIRYGRLIDGAGEPDWYYISHCDCDGIGGFARVLREYGGPVPPLPQTSSPCRGVIGPLWRLVFGGAVVKGASARRGDWQPRETPARAGPSAAVAWHAFTVEETDAIRRLCRERGITVNSYLLKHLDHAVRPEVQRSHLRVPWMVPVNLRGDIRRPDETENHVSCVEVHISADDTAADIQQQIRRRLERGEHRANQLLLGIGRVLSHAAKVRFLAWDRARPVGSIGAFSNLGVWDTEKQVPTGDAWLFCPPVVKGQLLGAGCVTFQGRLTITLHAHHALDDTPRIASQWMAAWRRLIEKG